MASGGIDGKVKLWDTRTYFCIATLEYHMAQVTDIKFSKLKDDTLVSTSFDGSIRAYDTKKYLNFRTMETEPLNKLMCVELEDSGDVSLVCLSRAC